MTIILMEQCNILFVCTGNICRSPTAEAVFRHEVRKAGLSDYLKHDSAGTYGYHIGDPADHRTISIAGEQGVDMSDLRARQLMRSDFEKFDLLLAMDKSHYDFMKAMAPSSSQDKIKMFMSYAPDAGYDDVPDPYYGEEEDFELVYRLVEKSVGGLLQCLQEK